MKYIATLLFALVCFWTGDAQAADPLKNLGELIKKPIVIKASSSNKMDVTFNHKSHMGKGFNCATCHHERLDENAYASCTNDACHSEPGARARDTMSMFMAFHAGDTDRSCYGCHTKLAAENPDKYADFAGCRPCHMSPQARKEVAAAAAKKK